MIGDPCDSEIAALTGSHLADALRPRRDESCIVPYHCASWQLQNVQLPFLLLCMHCVLSAPCEARGSFFVDKNE